MVFALELADVIVPPVPAVLTVIAPTKVLVLDAASVVNEPVEPLIGVALIPLVA